MARLEIREVSKTYPNGFRALENVSIDVKSGEFLTLLGPSGCGKTTLLKAIAGFHPVSSGKFLIDGKDVTTDSPERRDTAMCFQSYALFPHMTVAENILFGPRQNRLSKSECDVRLADSLRQVDLEAHSDKLPTALSGGQQQRVGLARAMAMRPGVILFDEPLSNLDAKLRHQVRFEMRALQAALGFTAIYVTHDQAEALAMSDRIAVMKAGRIEQIAPPSEIYDRPANRFVADFIGAANITSAEFMATDTANMWTARTEIGTFKIASDENLTGKKRYICWRPESAEIVENPPADVENTFTAKVVTQAYQGNVTDIVMRPVSGGSNDTVSIQTRKPETIGAELSIRLAPDAFSILEDV